MTSDSATNAAGRDPAGPHRAQEATGAWHRLPGSVRLAIAIVAVGVLAALALTMREPDAPFTPPERGDGQRVHDLAGVVDAEVVEQRLAALSETTGVDAVAVAWTDEQASLGQAARGAEELLQAWEADVALSAVAAPGAFTDADAGQRFFGLEADRLEISRGLRERIVEDAVPGPAGRNDWTGAFLAAADELEAELADQ